MPSYSTKGGKIIIEVSDSGKVIGANLTNSIKSQIQDFARNIDPPLSFEIKRVGTLILVHVAEGNKKPYSVNGQFFLRIGSNTQQLKRDEIREFFQKERVVLFDNQPNTTFDIKRDFDNSKFKSFLKLASITDNLDKKEILRNLFVIDGQYLKNAGVLFFCRKVTPFLNSATVACVLYQGTTKTHILDKKEFDSDLISNYDDALLYTISKLNTRYIIKKRTN